MQIWKNDEGCPCRIGDENLFFIGIFRAVDCNAQEGAHMCPPKPAENQHESTTKGSCFLVVADECKFVISKVGVQHCSTLFMVGPIIVACRLVSHLLLYELSCGRSCTSSRQQLYDGMLRTLALMVALERQKLCQIIALCCYKLLRQQNTTAR